VWCFLSILIFYGKIIMIGGYNANNLQKDWWSYSIWE
jgi:hypothetical protein